VPGTEFLGLTKQAAITAVNFNDCIKVLDRLRAIASFLQRLANKLRVVTNKLYVKHFSFQASAISFQLSSDC
jgi:hypothetical protein